MLEVQAWRSSPPLPPDPPKYCHATYASPRISDPNMAINTDNNICCSIKNPQSSTRTTYMPIIPAMVVLLREATIYDYKNVDASNKFSVCTDYYGGIENSEKVKVFECGGLGRHRCYAEC